METGDAIGTPMKIKDKLDLDQNGTLVDATKYRSMIGALMYLTSSRPDIVHATCLCSRYQANPTEKHLKVVKRIFRYLRGTVNMGLWYTKDSGFELTGFSDADYAGCKDTFKSTSGGTQFLGEKLDKSMTFLPYSSGATVKATYSFSKFKDKSSDIKQNLKTVLNFKDTLPQALINKNFLNELFQSRKIQDYLNAKDQDIKLKDKDIKSKIKIQDHRHAEGSSKDFPCLQGSKTQDVTRSEAICAMTTP
ncbi:hypothetical protein Tco_0377381 [Tanacetum coccineum]